MPQTFARRARHSSKAIVTAIVLTLAALIALTIAARDNGPKSVKTFGPVTSAPVGVESGLLPVIHR
ncbi:hypothetical protein [Hyphomicrobium denitrificans]|nr:hypothetical protein [Hyphomicrobium denitrificans]